MLQREMDSTVDYGVPLVKPKEGFFKKKLKIVNVTKKSTNRVSNKMIERVSAKVSTWGWLKSLARLEMPVQIISIIAVGTLLGAAYAVTMKSGDRQLQYMAGDSKTLSEYEFSQTIEMQGSIFQKNTAFDNPISKTVAVMPESERMLSLNSIIDQYITSEHTISPKDMFSHTTGADIVAPPSIVNEHEQKKIRNLEKQILLIQQKSEKLDLSDLRLKGKLELLVAKNRGLSDQLRHIDNLTSSIKNHYAGSN